MISLANWSVGAVYRQVLWADLQNAIRKGYLAKLFNVLNPRLMKFGMGNNYELPYRETYILLLLVIMAG